MEIIVPEPRADLMTLGRRVRHFRKAANLTLDELGERVGVVGSALSLIENGRREPKLSLLSAIAEVVGTSVPELLSAEAPDERTALEIELSKAQQSNIYGSLGLPVLPVSKKLDSATLLSLVGLHRELQRKAKESLATPEEARRANSRQRIAMQKRGNYLPELEELAEKTMLGVGHRSGALTHRTVTLLAEKLGFSLIYVDDLPHSVRSVTDLENGRIYLPPASIPGGHGLRSMALQAMAHRLLGHQPPENYADFLQQRLEINYFAAACLMPRTPSLTFLGEAKARKDLAIEDFRDAFGVTHEAAALRLTNLATSELGLNVHFVKASGEGAIQRAYENDGLPLPKDVTGSVEGQLLCRHWAARRALGQTNKTTENYQLTDTPAGTFWCATQTGFTEAGQYSITFGVDFADSKWFRGRDTTVRAESRCPDESCCRRPNEALRSRWAGRAWPSAKLHAHVLSPLPSGSFPGVDDTEVFDFLEAHAPQ